jgi:hypothetical protein
MRRESLPMSRLAALSALLTLSLLAVLLAASERVIGRLGVDGKLLRPLLYYQTVEQRAHRASASVDLHYELAPGASVDAFVPPPPRRVTVNALGFRDRERSARKPKGVFRIVCLGGSNTYGALVQNDETWPRRLEARLNAAGRRRYEVWNAGVSAYTLSQNVAAARAIVERYEPDLLIFQISNPGPRPFLNEQSVAPYFEADPALWAENLPFPRRPGRLHTALMRRWLFYRGVILLVNRVVADPGHEPLSEQNDGHNHEAFRRFASGAGRPPIALLGYPGGSIPSDLPLAAGRLLPTLELKEVLPRGAGREYLGIHPPRHVYAWYAAELASFLGREGLLPK